MVLIGKYLVALRQIGAAAIDEIDDGQAIFEGNVLGANVFADGFLEKGSALRRRVVGDDHADHAADGTDPRHQARARHGVVVKSPGGQR